MLPKVLIVVDTPGWAYDHKADSILENLEGYAFEKVYFRNFKWSMALDNDVVFLMGYFYFNPMEIPEIFREKVVSTLTSFGFNNSSVKKMMLPGLCHFYAKSGGVSPDLVSILEENNAKDPVLCMNGVDEKKFNKTSREIGADENIKVGLVCSSEDRGFDFKGLNSVAKPLLRNITARCSKIDFEPLIVDSFNSSNIKSKTEMVKYYQGLDLLISTSHRYSEGTPNPAFEAASCGLPIVSTENGCIKKLINHGENGFIADGWQNEKEASVSIDQLAGYILELEGDRTLLRDMGANARTSIEQNWTWKDRSKDYIDLFKLNG